VWVQLPPGKTVKYKYRWSTSKQGTTDGEVTMYFNGPTSYGGTWSNDKVTKASQTNATQDYTSKQSFVTPADGSAVRPDPAIMVVDGLLSGGNKTRLLLLDVALVDAATGATMMRLTDAGWQAKAWTGSAWV
jgi:hypothetical protein